METTTIQVEKPTKELLNQLKKGLKSRTYDEVIKALARKKAPSMYGKLAGRKKVGFAKMMKGLRDKNDRF